MSAPPAPNSIAKALIEGMLTYPDLPDTVWAVKVAEAVWDALLAEGVVRYAYGPLDKWVVPTFSSDIDNDDYFRYRIPVLVLPLAGREPEDATNA